MSAPSPVCLSTDMAGPLPLQHAAAISDITVVYIVSLSTEVILIYMSWYRVSSLILLNYLRYDLIEMHNFQIVAAKAGNS